MGFVRFVARNWCGRMPLEATEAAPGRCASCNNRADEEWVSMRTRPEVDQIASPLAMMASVAPKEWPTQNGFFQISRSQNQMVSPR